MLGSPGSPNGSGVELLGSLGGFGLFLNSNIEEIIVFRGYWALSRTHRVLTVHGPGERVAGRLLQALLLPLLVPVLVVVADVLQGVAHLVLRVLH